MLPVDPSRPLSAESIARSVHDSVNSAMAALPPDKNNAMFIDATYDKGKATGVQIGYVRRFTTDRGSEWKVVGVGEYVGTHVAGKVLVAGAW